MSAGGTKEKIGRLQELLERVQLRAAAARADGATDGGHAEAAHLGAAAPAYEATSAQTSPPPAAYVERDEEMSAAPATPAPAAAEEDYDVDTDSDVEVSSEVVEVDIDVDEPEPLESGAQPVAQQTMPPEDLEEEADEQPMATQPSVRPPVDEPREEEVAHAASPANEIEEPTPSSSRRPIAAEEASAEAYEPESSPRHTPPPESGKQVAAAPSNHPPSRKPSAPPPSLEGHTLIGGWREPGLGTPQISPSAGMSTGVRVPAAPRPQTPGGTEPPATVVQGAGAVAQASGTRLTADVTRPALASGASVASFTGAPAIAKPKTLGDLLDLTLGL
ncbi:MAG: hypothetical protein QOI41_295 [Myxococcales bacterium]|nr:hypothetical protein [Myxococcales bacterium]